LNSLEEVGAAGHRQVIIRRVPWHRAAPGRGLSATPEAHALIALGEIGCEPEQCVPAIVPFLSSTDIGQRQKAMGALSSFGTNALPARSAIQKALNDSDPWVRMEAKQAVAILDQANAKGQITP
jgi:HEAT repeats